MIRADCLTFQRHWAVRRSPAGWAGIWVAGGCQTQAEPQSVAAKTKSSVMFLIPESGDEGGRCRSKRGSTLQHNVVWNQKLNPNSVSSVDSWGPCLQFPPQPTLEAAHTVHDPGDVQEGQSDVLLTLYQQPWKTWKKHNGFTSWIPINPKIYCRWSRYMKELLTFSLVASFSFPANRDVSSKCSGNDLDEGWGGRWGSQWTATINMTAQKSQWKC